MSESNLRSQLLFQRDEKYKEFHQRLVNTQYPIAGVRVPDVRKLAKSIKTRDEILTLLHLPDPYYEEVLAAGLAIGALKESILDKEDLIREYISKIDNWALCDTFCSSLKSAKKERKEAFSFINEMLKSSKTFEVRFALVLLNSYYVQPDYMDFILKTIEEIRSEEYYINMAAAWLFSTCYIADPKKGWNWLTENKADDWIVNKGIQKCLESYRIDALEKEKLKGLRAARRKKDHHAV